MIIDSPIISGSYSASGSLNQSGNVVISGSLTITGGITGSISGSANSASYAANATSASYALTASYSANVPVTASFADSATSASYALTASFSLNVPVTASFANSATSASYAISASYVLNAVSSSFATSASQALTASYLSGYVSPFPFTGSAIISGSLEITGSASISNLSGSGVRYLVADESGSVTAQSASAALKSTQAFTSTAGQTTFSVTNGYSTGYVDVYINGSKLSTSEFTDTSGTNIILATGSFSGDVVEVVKYTPAAGVTNNVLRQLTTLTGSAGQTVFSASYTPGLLDIFYNGSRLSTSDYTANNGTYFTLATGSVDGDILDVLVYSYQVGAFNGIGGQGVVNQLAFFNTTSSITGSDSLTISGNTLVGTASYALNADTLDGAHLSILATTGSNTFTSAQYISNTSAPIGFTDTASLYTDGGLRATKTSYFSSSVYIGGDLVIFGSQSVNYITSSQLNIADNIITVNTSSPAVRFGGLAVQDSGSFGTGLTGSLLWDSQTNHWIYSNPSGSSYSGGMMISGPRNTGSIGDEQGTTFNALMKGQGGDHITSSGIFESSSFVGIGTSTPLAKLDVKNDDGVTDGLHIIADFNKAGSSSAELILGYYASGSAVTGPVVYAANSQPLLFGAGSAERMRLTVTGNLGIGTTSPVGKLDVALVNTRRFIVTYDDSIITIKGASDTGAGENLRIIGDNLIFNTNSVGSGTERMRITNAGQIGINTSSPVTTSLTGSITIYKAYNADQASVPSTTAQTYYGNQHGLYLFGRNSGLSIISAHNEEGSIKFGNASTAAYATIGTATGASAVGGDMYFKVGSDTERMRITSGGNIEIANGYLSISAGSGTAYTSRIQTVYSFPYIETYLDSVASVSYQGRIHLRTNAANGAFVTGIRIENSGAVFLPQYGNGTMSISGGQITTSSDKNLKTDDGGIDNALEKVLNLNPRYFYWKEDSGIETTERQLGFYAQNIQEALGTEVANKNSNGKWGIYDRGIIAMLTKSIQEQQMLITALQEKLERNNIN